MHPASTNPAAALKRGLPVLIGAVLSACALFPSWHWEKNGASDADYKNDEILCKARVYSGTDGVVTQGSVRRMHDCLTARGWRKAPLP